MAIPSFLWIQQGLGPTAVYVVIAVIVVIAAVAVDPNRPRSRRASPSTRSPRRPREGRLLMHEWIELVDMAGLLDIPPRIQVQVRTRLSGGGRWI